MESRIRQLQAMLKDAEIVDEAGSGDGSVALGSTVTLRYEGDDEDDTQRFFVGSIEERQGDLPVVSPSSPLGQALLGRGAGDTVEYEAPGGMLRVEIVGGRPLMARRPAHPQREGVGRPRRPPRPRASPTCSSSTCTWSTRSPRPRPSTGCGWPGRTVRRPDLTVATADHNVPTTDIDKPVADPVSAQQLEVLDANCAEFGITCYPMGDANQGIVHVIGPEQGSPSRA